MINSRFLPIIIEEDEDGIFVAECTIFRGCYSQGETKAEALKNLKEVIDICMEEEENKEIFTTFLPKKISFETMSYA